MTLPTHVIDISYAQPNATIDWKRVAATKIQGVMIRSGYGREVDGELAGHVAGAKSVKLDFGTYFYPLPDGDVAEAEAQADLMIEQWTDSAATLAPAADWEATTKESPIVRAIQQGDAAAAVQLADWIDAFMARADAQLAGRCQAMMYTGSWFQQVPRDRAQAHANRALWVASYTRPFPFIPWPWDETALWQHSANTIWRLPDGTQAWGPKKPDPNAILIAVPGSLDGIPGEVDCNMLSSALLAPLKTGVQPRCTLDLSNVRDRQRALRRLGFDPGSLDGQWGARSTRALQRVQSSLKLKPDGVWGPITNQSIAAALAAV